MPRSVRLLVVQYAGDYREAFYNFTRNEPETYYAQRYSVEIIADIGKQVEEVTTLCCLTKERYNEVLTKGVRAIGAGFQNNVDAKQVIDLAQQQQPTHLVLRTPMKELINWSVQNRIKTLMTLADSFGTKGWRTKARNYLLAKSLNQPNIEWVGNHGTNSSQQLRQIGVNPRKIVPWDWPHFRTPEQFPLKMHKCGDRPMTLIYVGSVSEAKGVGDILQAMAILQTRNLPVRLRVIGKGETDFFKGQAKQLKIESLVEFVGLVPNDQIIPSMQEADVVVISSRHNYPEGFPMTIYEALCSHTPIVASDHPMFQGKLQHQVNAMIFQGSNPTDLADQVMLLQKNKALYEQISKNTSETWHKLQIPVKWADLVQRWLSDSPEDRQWLLERSLALGNYS